MSAPSIGKRGGRKTLMQTYEVTRVDTHSLIYVAILVSLHAVVWTDSHCGACRSVSRCPPLLYGTPMTVHSLMQSSSRTWCLSLRMTHGGQKHSAGGTREYSPSAIDILLMVKKAGIWLQGERRPAEGDNRTLRAILRGEVTATACSAPFASAASWIGSRRKLGYVIFYNIVLG